MFKQRLLCSSIATVTALSGMQVVQAQDAEPVEEIVVTGVRASLEKGIEIKREKIQIVDSIVAEDIGKFPDNNVVEALQRVTGVQVTDRGAGEVSGVSIRGLTDVGTTINGRQIFTASSRDVSLQDVPASLLSGVDVYKTRSASQLESGIAGQVDIHTHRPFDFDGSKVSLAGRGIYQEQADSTDPNLSALFSNRWETSAGEFGALVNLSYAETNFRDQSVTAGAGVLFVGADAPDGFVPYQRIFNGSPEVGGEQVWQEGLEKGMPFAPGSTVNINGEDVEYLIGRDAVFAVDGSGERERPAANISLQWAPNDSSEYLFEAFYNGYRSERFNSLNFTFVDSWEDSSHLPRGGEIEVFDGTNIVKTRDVAASYGFTSGDLLVGKTDSYLYAVGGKWDIGDRLQLRSELNYQKSEYKETFFAMRAERVAYGLGVDFNAGDGVPEVEFYDDPNTEVDESNLADASQWNAAQLYDQGASRKGDAFTWTFDGDLELDLGAFHRLSFGVRADNRTANEASKAQDGGILGVPLGDLDPGLTYTSRGFFDGRADVATRWVVPDGHHIASNAGTYREMYGLTKQPLEETFEIDELTTSLYAKALYEAGPFDGEIGLRYTRVKRDMEFYDVEFESGEDGYFSSASTSDGKLLPTLVARWHINDDLMARFAYTQTLRHPGFASLNSHISWGDDVTNIGLAEASGGNPDLEPTESQNFDLSLEWYFAESSALYGTLFRRNIDGFEVTSRRVVWHQPEGETEERRFALTQPTNSSDGVLQGLELGVVYFPENLPDFLDGLGVQASYTALDSEQKVDDFDNNGDKTGQVEVPMFGVSDSSYSVVLAYDKSDLDMRLSYVWRDDFLHHHEARLFANPVGVYNGEETSLDFQASYSPMENLTFTFDATNLLDDYYQSYYEYPDIYNFGSSIYSRTFALGARYSF
ncbi:TonB-dependent receptor [Microbulbifer rhizosphaerae]|uniref:TonB-dependent receptor n=1 Tax=Microbulbifer rhizosphaerae TaxID=1562603 RepID=A0A7W4Z8R7_9GAMM|nr:TonB-dependent receptor [Microbulbifer rhizosphaerae]MBB3060867.1 TonB-dependent receptor [Microbulbifer rhizosphaerae]